MKKQYVAAINERLDSMTKRNQSRNQDFLYDSELNRITILVVDPWSVVRVSLIFCF